MTLPSEPGHGLILDNNKLPEIFQPAKGIPCFIRFFYLVLDLSCPQTDRDADGFRNECLISFLLCSGHCHSQSWLTAFSSTAQTSREMCLINDILILPRPEALSLHCPPLKLACTLCIQLGAVSSFLGLWLCSIWQKL